jgi:inorganic triphosphatase YgiF
MEVEAKLEAPQPAVLDAIARRKRLGPYEIRSVGTRDLETVYLDTARANLLSRGIALRLRRAKDTFELTLKLPGEVSRGVHRRPETTWRLRRMPSLPFRPSGRLGRELSRWTAGGPLLPTVGTRVRRHALFVRHPGGGAPVAEVDLDRVEFFRPGEPNASRRADARFYEVEVELLGGDEGDLRKLVRALRERYPLRGTRKSKLERALRWASMVEPTATTTKPRPKGARARAEGRARSVAQSRPGSGR